MRTLTPTLEAEQKKESLTPLVKIVLTLGANNYTYDKSRILDTNPSEQPYNQKAEVVLDNSDDALTDINLKGFKGVISKGAVTSAGKEYDASAPLWVIAQQFNSSPGKLDCTLSLIGIPNLLAEDRANAIYQPDETDTKTVKTLLTEIITASLACYSHCKAYEVVFDSEDSLIDTYVPKDSFRIYVNGSRLAAIRRLLDYTKCVGIAKADGKFHIFQPTITGSVYDYEYSLATGHTFFSKALRNRLVIPGCIIVQSQPDDDPQYSGLAKDPSYDSLPAELKQPQYEQTYLESNAQAVEIAEALLSKYQLWAEMGAADVPMNVGAEVFDYVRVVDARQGDERAGNIGSLTRHWNAQKAEWRLTFSFGGWLSVRKLLSDIETNPSGFGSAGQSFSRLNVKDLYAENILAKNVDFVWIDPDNTIDLSQIGDTLDGLPDGEVFARVKTLHLDAGIIQLNENIVYKASYDPSEKRRNFTATPTTPYDVGDMWHDGSVVKRCTTARASGAYVAGDWTQETIDELADGVTYQRARSSALTAAGLVILDQVVTGTYGLIYSADLTAHHLKMSAIQDYGGYGKVLLTDLAAGHIKLTSQAVKDGEWYNESGVEIDAAHGINIYGTNNAFTTRATKTGTIQCYVGADGKIYAGAGAVYLDSSGITFEGLSRLKFVYAGGLYPAYIGNLLGSVYVDPCAGHKLWCTKDIYSAQVFRTVGTTSGGFIFERFAKAEEGSIKIAGGGNNDIYIYSNGAWRMNG